MASPAPAPLAAAPDPPSVRLGSQERAVLAVLLEHPHRVLSRAELAQRSGLAGRSARRCDSVLVLVRRALGPGSIATVRGRGWMLHPQAIDLARGVFDQSA